MQPFVEIINNSLVQTVLQPFVEMSARPTADLKQTDDTSTCRDNSVTSQTLSSIIVVILIIFMLIISIIIVSLISCCIVVTCSSSSTSGLLLARITTNSSIIVCTGVILQHQS